MRVQYDEDSVDRLFEGMVTTDHPGVTVGIAVSGEPVYRKAFGAASMELPVALTPSTRMRIASITKQFTSLAFLLLCERGQARVDDLATDHLEGRWPALGDVTVRHLMGHTSGLRDVHDLAHQFAGTQRFLTQKELLSLYNALETSNYPAGHRWNYNNGGYLILTAVVEQIAQKPLGDVFRDLIFKPIGMSDTELRRSDNDFFANSAAFHMVEHDGRYSKHYINKEQVGEGGIVSNVDDMLRWLKHMDKPVVGDAETWRSMKCPQVLAHGGTTGYGFGLTLDKYRGYDVVSHSGGLLGCNSHLMKISELELDIIVMSNRHDVSSAHLAYEIVDGLLGPQSAAHAYSAVTGAFCCHDSEELIELIPRANGEQGVAINGTPVSYYFGTPDTLYPLPRGRVGNQSIKLIGDPEQPKALWFQNCGTLRVLDSVRDEGESDPSDIRGSYRSDELDASIDILEGGLIRTTCSFGACEAHLDPVVNRVWRVRPLANTPWFATLRFSDNCRELYWTSTRTNALQFRRVE